MLASLVSNQLYALWLLEEERERKKTKENDVISVHFKLRRKNGNCLQNALATAILSRIEINGNASMDEPTCVIISVK